MKSLASTVLGIVMAIIGVLLSLYWNIKLGTAVAMIAFAWILFTRITGFPGILLGAFIAVVGSAARCVWDTTTSMAMVIIGFVICILGIIIESPSQPK